MGNTASDTPSQCPVKHADQSGSGCPVKKSGVNPNNQMPSQPDQSSSPGHEVSKDRIKSTIPKGGGADTWEYPSSQMFYNSLLRKGKEIDFDQSELDTIVAVHNNMNERAWDIVMNWEKSLHKEEYEIAPPTLNRFIGRPDDLTPKAWFRTKILGHEAPFDRHDWFLERAGKQVRYVIDFYYDESLATNDKVPTLHDARSIQSISMDARPAVDSLESLLDRFKYTVMGISKVENKAANIEIVKESKPVQNNIVATDFQKLDRKKMGEFSNRIGAECTTCFEKVSKCSSKEDCENASIALSFCMASIVCPSESESCVKQPESEANVTAVFKCLDDFEARALQIRNEK